MSATAGKECRSPLRALRGVQIVGTGSYLPDNIVRNEDLAQLGCDPDWILQRTGIRERRHVPEGLATSDLALRAGRRCLEAAGADPADVDLLLLGTFTPDYLMPSCACLVQDRLGLRCPAADISAACAGFVYSMVTGMQYVATGCSKLALVIGADCTSRALDPADKKTYPLFGDGAGAVLLAAGSDQQGLVSYTLGSDGSGWDLLCRQVGGVKVPFAPVSDNGKSWYVTMDGRPVFKWAVRVLQDTIADVLTAAEQSIDDIGLWILHQANTRIIDAAVENMGIDREKVVVHLERYGNTSAASIPIALDESVRAGRVQRGSRVVMSGFGAGLTWGTAVLEW